MARDIQRAKPESGIKPLSPSAHTLRPPEIKPLVGPGPALSTKMGELNTRMVSTSTLDRFIGPIQSFIEALVESARQPLVMAQQRRERKAQERALEIARLLMEAEAEMHQGNWSSAINILDRVLRMDRTVYEAVYLKAVCLAALERLNEAIGLASDGARRCPKPQLRQEFGNLVEALQFIVAILPLVKGILAMLAGQHRDALGWFEQALRKDPNDPFVLSHKAICLMYAHRWQEALDTLTKVERQFRDDPIHHYHRCVCYLELGDPSRARNALQEARSRNPAAELRQVLDRMETAIEYAPRRGAIEAMNAERWNDALNQLQGLVRRNGNDAWAHYHIAVCHAKIAEDHLLSRYPNRAAAFQSITSARQAVEQADYYCDRGDTELRGAIDNLRSQLPR